MKDTAIRGAGLLSAALYAGLITWVYAYQPRTVAQLTGGMAASVGAYAIDRTAFDQGLQFFRNEQFEEARAALARADPARQDPTTQFYIAYSYYRQGWGRMYNDDALFAKGLEAVERAIVVAPDHRLDVADPSIDMRSADELRAELARGLRREPSDINPMRLLAKRK